MTLPIGLADDERDLVSGLRSQMAQFRVKNQRQWNYYDGKQGLKNMGIAIPQNIAMVEAVIGWPEIVVDALEERLDWQGWVSAGADVSGLQQVFRKNQLGIEFAKATLDSFVTGVGFLQASDDGEGNPLVNAVSSSRATYVWDERLRRVSVGMVEELDPEGVRRTTVFYPDETVTFNRDEYGETVERVVHGRGRAGLVPYPNRTRAGQVRGRSEINRAIRYYTDHGTRTILGMEFNREIYTTPQRWLANVEPDQLGLSEDATQAQIVEAGWKVAQNKALIIPPNPEGDGAEPKVGQFQAASPAPYIDELRMLSQMVSAQSGVPVGQFGFITENPASADAIRMAENRLVKKAERRQSMFGQTHVNDLAYVCQSILDGAPASPEFTAQVSAKWRDASTPTLAAATDAAVKIVSAGIAPGRSRVIMDMIGLAPEQQESLEADWSRDTSRSLGEMLRTRQVEQDPVVDAALATRTAEEDTQAVEGRLDIPAGADADTLAKKFDALGKAIRAGVDPDDAAARLGLPGLHFTGAIPVSLRVPKSEGEGLEEK